MLHDDRLFPSTPPLLESQQGRFAGEHQSGCGIHEAGSVHRWLIRFGRARDELHRQVMRGGGLMRQHFLDRVFGLDGNGRIKC
jgi:hypothetical protein